MKISRANLWAVLAVLALVGGPVVATRLLQPAPVPRPAADDRTIKEIMASMVDPAGDFLFESVQQVSDARGVTQKAPHTDADWKQVRDQFEVLAAAPALLTAPNRRAGRPGDRSKNPLIENVPPEVERLLAANRSGFASHAKRLGDAAAEGLRAVEARDVTALSTALLSVDRACESCHLQFYYPNDKRAKQAAREEWPPETPPGIIRVRPRKGTDG